MTTEEERNIMYAVHQLKKRLKEVVGSELYEDDSAFLRFLKARNFNVDNAETMIRKHLEFRKRYDVDNISKFRQPEVLEKYLPFVMIGYDKEGCVVRYCPAGNVDWIGLDLAVKREDFAKRLIYDIFEDETQLKNQSEKLGKTVDKCVYIFNLENLSFAQATSKRVILTAIFMCDLYQNNYPERLKAMYVINAFSYFNLVFSVMKSLLANSILDKIRIFSDGQKFCFESAGSSLVVCSNDSNHSESALRCSRYQSGHLVVIESYKEELLKLIDPDVLPAFLGGERTDPDGNPLCTSFISQGGPVPETYYIHKSKRSLADLSDVQKLTLTRATFHEIYQEVKEPGSYLEWEFETKCRDIGFGLFYQDMADGGEKMKELISIQRIETDEYAETGMYLCEKSGTYVIVFDNTYSWIRAKEIYYRVKIITPEEQEKGLMK